MTRVTADIVICLMSTTALTLCACRQTAVSNGNSEGETLCSVYGGVFGGIELFSPDEMRLVLVSETSPDNSTVYFREAAERLRALESGMVASGELTEEERAFLLCLPHENETAFDEVEESVRGTRLYYDTTVSEKVAERSLVLRELRDRVVTTLGEQFGSAFDDYLVANEESSVLDLSTCDAIRQTIISATPDELSNLSRCAYWTEYHERFPSTGGIVRLSVPGFSVDNAVALVYASRAWGGLGMESYFVGLRRSGKSWVVVGTVWLGSA